MVWRACTWNIIPFHPKFIICKHKNVQSLKNQELNKSIQNIISFPYLYHNYRKMLKHRSGQDYANNVPKSMSTTCTIAEKQNAAHLSSSGTFYP